MRISLRTKTVILGVAASILAILGCVDLSNASKGHPTVFLKEDVISFGTLRRREVAKIACYVENRSSRPLTVLGGDLGCHKKVCISATHLPLSVPAWGQVRVEIELLAQARGSTDETLSLFTDREGEDTITIRICGSIDGSHVPDLPPVVEASSPLTH